MVAPTESQRHEEYASEKHLQGLMILLQRADYPFCGVDFTIVQSTLCWLSEEWVVWLLVLLAEKF